MAANRNPDDDGPREWTELDSLYGEWIARDVEKRVRENVEHYNNAHNRSPLDDVADFLFGGSTKEECINPRCPAFEEDDDAPAESWWERWFRSPGEGNDDGESGSSD